MAYDGVEARLPDCPAARSHSHAHSSGHPTSSMLCPQGHPLPVPDFTAKFCPTCGAALINPCPVGHDNVANARFCRECGRSMGLVSGTPTMAGVSVVPPTTAVVPAEPAATPTIERAVGQRPAGTTMLPPPSDYDDTQDGPRHRKGLLIAIVAVAVAVVAVVIAAVATNSSTTADPSSTTPTSGTPSTTIPPTSSTSTTSTTLSPHALTQAQTLSALISQSSNNRSQVGAATAAIASCGDLVGAQSTLSAAQASRHTLVSQLGQLDLSALPQSTALPAL